MAGPQCSQALHATRIEAAKLHTVANAWFLVIPLMALLRLLRGGVIPQGRPIPESVLRPHLGLARPG